MSRTRPLQLPEQTSLTPPNTLLLTADMISEGDDMMFRCLQPSHSINQYWAQPT